MKFFKNQSGNAASILIIFSLTFTILISILLMFIYSWEVDIIKDIISEVVIKEVYSDIFRLDSISLSKYNDIQKIELEETIKNQIIDKFILKNKSFLYNLSVKKLYKKEVKIIPSMKKDYENSISIRTSLKKEENIRIIEVAVKIKFCFPKIFLMALVKGDNIIDDKGKGFKKKRCEIFFEESYAID